MSHRPKPRKSKLSGLTPVQPAGTLPSPAPLDGFRKNGVPSAKGNKIPDTTLYAKETPAKSGVLFYQNPEDTGRIRRAVLYSSLENKAATLSDFIAEAVMKEVVKYEKRYNGGTPFAPIYPQTNKKPKK